ncbi:MAG: adenine phosphoribosyltransferase [Lachnospiraceae bacterium]|nr:adenine phosphoribosyltransferase [Lachnospiraceae bacterium]
MKRIEDYVTTIPNFPKEGIMFRDVTTVLSDADGLKLAVDELTKLLEGIDFDVLVGTESRGFIFGSAIAYNLHKPLVLARKKGKLPRKTVSAEYELEYGTDVIEMHADSIKPGQKVVLVDDLLATGGTMKATASLVEEMGGEVVKIIFLMELSGLKGTEKLAKYDVKSVVSYPGA